MKLDWLLKQNNFYTKLHENIIKLTLGIQSLLSKSLSYEISS